MPDIAKLLKDEIRRIARSEARTATSTLTQKIGDLKKQNRAQGKQIKELHSALKTKVNKKDTGAIDPLLSKGKPVRAVRTSPKSIKQHRKRHKLSQRQVGLLLGVSSLTVSKWETGNAKPRGKNMEAFGLFRSMGLKEVQARLADVDTPRKKRGRKTKKKK